MMDAKVVITYVPVLHRGYLDFFRLHSDAEVLCLIDTAFLREFAPDAFDYIIRKDVLRALDAEEVRSTLRALELFPRIEMLDFNFLRSIRESRVTVVMPDEDVCRAIAEKHLSGSEVLFESVFLRWHRDNVEENRAVQADRTVSTREFDVEMMLMAQEEAPRSSDWWRQVGGILVKDGAIIMVAHNTHVPHEQVPYAFGDPRALFKRGINIELSSADHAEAVLVGEAARRGVPLKGTWLYVTDFPCPPCSKLVARSGIARCYFSGGYALLSGEDDMKGRGVELIYVDVEQKNDPSS